MEGDRGRGTAAEVGQSSAELTPEDAVDDEVDRRVGRDGHVAGVVVVVGLAARVRHPDDVDELVDERRSLADQEDDDDDDHYLSEQVITGVNRCDERSQQTFNTIQSIQYSFNEA